MQHLYNVASCTLSYMMWAQWRSSHQWSNGRTTNTVSTPRSGLLQHARLSSTMRVTIGIMIIISHLGQNANMYITHACWDLSACAWCQTTLTVRLQQQYSSSPARCCYSAAAALSSALCTRCDWQLPVSYCCSHFCRKALPGLAQPQSCITSTSSCAQQRHG
jgi:hypothetical protein